jgi:pimeloyl-ACP methyl ester carboxylesterase
VRYATNGEVRIWWDEHGSGTPAMLIMGFAYGSAMWHRAVTALSPHHRVLTFDNRGVGYSDAPHGPYAIEEMASDAVAVLDAAGVEQAHVYGASMGGLIAQEVALAHPQRVRSLVLGCTGCIDTTESPTRLQRILVHLAPPAALMRPSVARMYGPGVSAQAQAEDLLLVRSTRHTRRGLLGQAQAIGAYRSRHRLAQLEVPTLVIHGDADQVVSLERGKDLAAAIPGARFEVIKGAGHNYATEPDCDANRLVLDFWSALDRS